MKKCSCGNTYMPFLSDGNLAQCSVCFYKARTEHRLKLIEIKEKHRKEKDAEQKAKKQMAKKKKANRY